MQETTLHINGGEPPRDATAAVFSGNSSKSNQVYRTASMNTAIPNNLLESFFKKAESLFSQGEFNTSLATIRSERRYGIKKGSVVAVVGEFKAGKSTFINAAFLKQPLLFTDLMEATCVPTELAYGDSSRLLVYPFTYREESVQFADPSTDAPANDETFNIRVGEEPAFIIEDPDRQEIRNETTGDTPDERMFKARKIARVRLERPLANLRELTVVDTAGINTTNTAIVETTYGVLPKCDAAILVVQSGQLTSAEEHFLRSRVFEAGTTRLFVVINQFENRMPLGDAGRKQMSDAMKAQLNSIGREHVPIAIVDAQKWLDALQSRGPIPEDAEATQQQLERFLRLDLATARTEKAVTVLQREVRRAILETQAELALQDKNETELKRLSTQVEKREADLLPKLELAADVFVDEIHDALVRFKHQTRAGLSKASNQFVEKLRIDTDLGHTQAMIRDAQHILQPEFEAVLADASRDLRQAMRLAGQKYEKEARALLAGLDIHDFSHWKQNQPGLAEIPAPVVILLDYLAVVLLLPLPIIADVLIRLLVDRFPQLQKLMPTGIAHALMVRQFEVGLRNQVTTSLREIEENLDKAFQKIRGEVNASVRKQIEGEVAPLRVAIQHVREKTSPSRRAALTQMHVSLGSLHGELLNLIPR